MNCPNCGAPVPESESVCPSCGAQMETPEARARGKWERRRQERKKKKNKQEKNQVTVEEIRDPNAELVQSLVAELDEMQGNTQPDAEKPDEPAEYTGSEAEEMPAEDRYPEAEGSAEEPESEAEETDSESEKRSMLEQQGTVHINVEEALASLPQEEQDDFPDLRIPEIYARAKYVPSSSQKWAERAARDVEDDWEGFDPENEDWMEEEDSSHPAVSLVVGIVLLISVLLALYSYFTSDLTGGISMTVGSMM